VVNELKDFLTLSRMIYPVLPEIGV
jgi:hypothetical protein